MTKRLTKSERSRRRIMLAAKELYEKEGLGNVNFARIAEAAGVCRSTVFNHFPSEEDMLKGIFAQRMEEIIEDCETSKLEGTEFVREFFRKLLWRSVDYPNFSIQITAGALTNDTVSEPIREVDKIIAKNLPKDSNPALLDMLFGAYYGIISGYVLRGMKVTPAELSEEMDAALDTLLK